MSYKNLNHKSVLLNEVIEYLNVQDNDLVFDGTFGAGGYSKKILEVSNCKIIATDKDPDVNIFAKDLQENYKDRIQLFYKSFAEIDDIIVNSKFNKLNALVLDLGVSSMQLDSEVRGFSFQHNASLDMRMSKEGISAADVVNEFSESDIADIIYLYGGEHNSRKIARKICFERKKQPINTTKELNDMICSVYGRKGKISPATKTFQALRIYVNKELDDLNSLLEKLPTILQKGARVVIVTFHELEDRIVKHYFKNNKHQFNIITKKVVKPAYEEIRENRRSRSSKLRCSIYNGASDE